MLTILFDGVAYGMLLFVLACGLAVTLGLMNFVNLAHGAFAMAGGYVTVMLMNRWGVPFLACLPVAFVGAAALGLRARAHALPATCTASRHLDQVLFSIGLVFMAVAAVDYFMGSSQQNITAAGLAAGPRRDRWASASASTARSSSWSAARWRSACSSTLIAHPLRQPAARRGRRRRAWRAGSASTSARCSPSPSRSARASRASAARWAPRCSGSIPTSR